MKTPGVTGTLWRSAWQTGQRVKSRLAVSAVWLVLQLTGWLLGWWVERSDSNPRGCHWPQALSLPSHTLAGLLVGQVPSCWLVEPQGDMSSPEWQIVFSKDDYDMPPPHTRSPAVTLLPFHRGVGSVSPALERNRAELESRRGSLVSPPGRRPLTPAPPPSTEPSKSSIMPFRALKRPLQFLGLFETSLCRLTHIPAYKVGSPGRRKGEVGDPMVSDLG